MGSNRTVEEWSRLDVARTNFDQFLHALRTEALRSTADAGPVVLSAGCSGRWYFDWVRENYAGVIDRHIGVEAFSPRPSDLPPEAVWIDNTLDAMTDVPDDSVDLVIAGQVVEHLWPEVLAGLLLEARRVLRPGGVLVVDSPERSITNQLGWTQSEHTVELCEWEARELLTLAGFADIDVRGLWLCRDPRTALALPLDPAAADGDWRDRVAAADDRPGDSFVWWIACRPTGAAPNEELLLTRCHEIWKRVWPDVVGRSSTQGERVIAHDREHLRVAAGEVAYPLFGPYSPLAPGSWALEVTLEVGELPPEALDEELVFEVDVTRGATDDVFAVRRVTVGEIRRARGSHLIVTLPFRLEDTAFRWQRRVLSSGITDLTVLAHLTRLRRAEPEPHRLGLDDVGQSGSTPPVPRPPGVLTAARDVMTRASRLLRAGRQTRS